MKHSREVQAETTTGRRYESCFRLRPIKIIMHHNNGVERLSGDQASSRVPKDGGCASKDVYKPRS